MAQNERETTAEDYDAWRNEVRTVMAANARGEKPRAASAPVQREVIPPAPASAVPMLPHLQAKRSKPRLEAMNVRVRVEVLEALDRYVRHHGVAKQDAVSDMLAHMLTIAGFAPVAD